MHYFMTEVQATDWQRSVAWYCAVLGLRIVLQDPPHQFALLQAGPDGGRVAIKGGAAAEDRGSVRLVFEVVDLDERLEAWARQAIPLTGPRTSHEGYREVTLHDPDGTPVGIFAWVR